MIQPTTILVMIFALGALYTLILFWPKLSRAKAPKPRTVRKAIRRN